MKLELSVIAPEADQELRSLYEWLRDEPVIRQSSQISLSEQEVKPGDMGDTLDLITLLVTSGLALPGFIQTVASWAATRRSRPTVVIKREDVRVEITGMSIDDAIKMAKALESED
ncbi:hypothetical protein ACIBHX_38310 [Nonomuraea sp. NPDC050536]|uniref:effector-associated constant component EACC1 n=1 Tax=Nonomuraea sp. NPDC050536 TaxID=3364366 RepID=UPI0037C81D8C